MKKITRKNLEAFLAKHATDQLVLDIGGGHVDSNHSYTKFFPNRHTVDVDPVRQPDTVGDVHDLPFADNSYDFILCTEVLEHLHSPHVAVAELHRVLKPGGTLLLTTRFVYPLHDTPHDYFRFTKYGLEFLFREFKSAEVNADSKTFTATSALIQRIIFQTKLKGGKITKGLIVVLVAFLSKLDFLIKEEFGDIGKKNNDAPIIANGYCVVAQK